MPTTPHNVIVRRRLAVGLSALLLAVGLMVLVNVRSGGRTPAASPTTSSKSTPKPDLVAIKANELGRVPVMEWHDVGKVDGRWTTSTGTFKTQLQQMYDAGLRPVTVADFVAGRFNVEAGKTPVVLTFDDSFKSHLYFGPNGKPDPESVVGMLEDFAASHKGWKATAVFYIYYPAPFRESALVAKKLHYLVDNGFEVGNHSLGHDNLSTFDDEGVQKSLGGLQKKVDETLPKYRLASLALPYGTWPKNRALAVTGDFEGKRYWHDVIFLVGDMPAISPFDERYDPTKVMRVQAYEFDKWMKWMQVDGRRFVSDGDPKTIAYPEDTKFTVRKVSGLNPVSYSPS